MATDVASYRRGILAKHKPAFDFYSAVSSTLEEAIVAPHARNSIVLIVLDMLIIQCSKAHAAVALLSQHGLMEDTATIARRLLELSVQTVYIAAEDDEKLRTRKAGMYLAFMWRQWPSSLKHKLPPKVRGQWSQVARKYGRFVPMKRKTWCPNWRDLFTEVGQEALYLSDYSFLSAIAHGRSDHQIMQFSQHKVPVHSDQFVSILVVYSSKYYLAAADVWNQHTKLIPPERMELFRKQAVAWTF